MRLFAWLQGIALVLSLTLLTTTVAHAAVVDVFSLEDSLVTEKYVPAWRSVTTDVCREDGAYRCGIPWALERAQAAEIFSAAAVEYYSTLEETFISMEEWAAVSDEEQAAMAATMGAELVQICPGDEDLFMSFYNEGVESPVFYEQMSVELSECTQALAWTYYDQGVQYTLYRVLACGNLAGRVEDFGTALSSWFPEPLWGSGATAAAVGSSITSGFGNGGGVHSCSCGGGNGGGGGHEPSPVPVPASFLLLLVALGFICLLGQPRRQLAT